MKLVRDHIPNIILGSGRQCHWYKVNSKTQHMAFLKEKMLEEMDEFLAHPCEEEAADMLEVLKAMISIEGIGLGDVIEKAEIKEYERGGFGNGIVLTKIE